MLQAPSEQQRSLEMMLSALAFREQAHLFFQATQHLPPQEKDAIFGTGGKQLLQKRFLPLVLHLLSSEAQSGR